MDEEDSRQEYYLDTIKRIVEDQKQFLGEETAMKWVRKTPVKVSDSGEVTGFYGRGEDAVEILRDYTENQEFYLEAINRIVDEMESFFGEKVALSQARGAPLRISPEGEIEAYYGHGRKALMTLARQYEEYMGRGNADFRIRQALQDVVDGKDELLPPRIRPTGEEDEKESFIDRIGNIFGMVYVPPSME